MSVPLASVFVDFLLICTKLLYMCIVLYWLPLLYYPLLPVRMRMVTHLRQSTVCRYIVTIRQ